MSIGGLNLRAYHRLSAPQGLHRLIADPISYNILQHTWLSPYVLRWSLQRHTLANQAPHVKFRGISSEQGLFCDMSYPPSSELIRVLDQQRFDCALRARPSTVDSSLIRVTLFSIRHCCFRPWSSITSARRAALCPLELLVYTLGLERNLSTGNDSNAAYDSTVDDLSRFRLPSSSLFNDSARVASSERSLCYSPSKTQTIAVAIYTRRTTIGRILFPTDGGVQALP